MGVPAVNGSGADRAHKIVEFGNVFPDQAVEWNGQFSPSDRALILCQFEHPFGEQAAEFAARYFPFAGTLSFRQRVEIRVPRAMLKSWRLFSIESI